jgi:hypothetical protein
MLQRVNPLVLLAFIGAWLIFPPLILDLHYFEPCIVRTVRGWGCYLGRFAPFL